MKKNILVISFAYPPTNVVGALRPYYISKHLNKSGNNVTVITSRSHKKLNGLDEYHDHEIYSPSISPNGKVKVIYIGKYLGRHGKPNANNLRPKSPLKSALNHIVYKVAKGLSYPIYPDKAVHWSYLVQHYLKKNSEIVNNTDIIISTYPAPSNHNIAKYIKRINPNIHWIADFRDFYYQNNLQHQPSFKNTLHKRLESKFIREADSLIFVTESMLEKYQLAYSQYRHKMQCIYNGFDKEDIISIDSKPAEPKLSIFYAGSFYNLQRSPFPLLKILDISFSTGLLNEKDINIKIAGNIDEVTKSRIAKYKSSSCIEYLGVVPRKEAINYMAKSTFLWLIVANIPSHYETVPAKLFEYIGVRRPILNFAPDRSEASRIIEANKIGHNFNTMDFDLEKSYQVFQELVVAFKSGKYNTALPESITETFSWQNRVLLLEDILHSL